MIIMDKASLSTEEIQKISLDILKEISSLCDKLNLRYFLTYGTLLGAIRHKGFIPWDDDVDIMMPRVDYDKLLEYFTEHSSEFPNLELFNLSTCKAYPYMISRFSDNRYLLEVENERPYGIGVFIDVYPLDGLGDTLEEAKSLARKGDIYSSFYFQSTREHYDPRTLTSNHKLLKAIIKVPIFLIAKLCGKKYFENRINKLTYKDYDKSKFVGPLVWLVGGEENIFLRESFDKLIEVPFEEYTFKVPEDYDNLLKKMYGDYMKLPPEKDRIGHHYYEAYKK